MFAALESKNRTARKAFVRFDFVLFSKRFTSECFIEFDLRAKNSAAPPIMAKTA
jgi:hypothetical protein